MRMSESWWENVSFSAAGGAEGACSEGDPRLAVVVRDGLRALHSDLDGPVEERAEDGGLAGVFVGNLMMAARGTRLAIVMAAKARAVPRT